MPLPNPTSGRQHAHKGDAIWEWYRNKLLQKYEITESDLTENLGIRYRIDYENQIIRMDQTAFLEKVVRTFGMTGSKPAQSPIHYGKIPTSMDAPDNPGELCRGMESFPMEKCMGCLLFILHDNTRELFGLPVRCLSFHSTSWVSNGCQCCEKRRAVTAWVGLEVDCIGDGFLAEES